ncbi:hypothetical protein PL373_13535 [Tenacibaculum maritimum]|nr:hypothetical protein [Tenacibaculum maritimum]MDB0602152.1 hypothetical protein [Tenacibaculum maritimum]MDB0613827.1 hypothetical protein [Tenacibaculum maritimum]
MSNLKIEIQGRKSIIELNGKTSEHKTAFIKKMTVNDLLLYLETIK